MDLDDLTTGAASDADIAMKLIKTFGAVAGQHARDQTDRQVEPGTRNKRWHDIARVIDTLCQANLHMEAALDLLDSVKETAVPPHLDAAIVQLGLRHEPTVPSTKPVDLASLTERYYHQRAEQHLKLAEAEPDAEGKGVHLDIAARYATLRELVLRSSENQAQLAPS